MFEIGAGTGGTSAAVLEKIKPYQDNIAQYCYTDLSGAFLLHGQKAFGLDNPFLDVQVFDVSQPITSQEVRAGGYDLVIAANVLHATPNIHQALRNAKALLKTNGLLLLIEISAKSIFAHLTFGLLDGWWLYEDDDLRIPSCPGVSSENWQSVLEKEGFDAVLFPARSAHDLGQQILVAQSDGMVRLPRQIEDVVDPFPPASTLAAQKINPLSAEEDPGQKIDQSVLTEKIEALVVRTVSKFLKVHIDSIILYNRLR